MNFVLFKIFVIKWVNPALVFVYFCLFHMTQFKYKFIKASMTCLGLEPGVAGADKSTELWRHLKQNILRRESKMAKSFWSVDEKFT